MAKNTYVSGLWNLYCDSCAIKIKASEAKKRWDGLVVCPSCYEERQPQDFVKAKLDRITVPFARPSDPWKSDVPLGLFDRVQITDSDIKIIFGSFYNAIETLPVSEFFLIERLISVYEGITLTEDIEFTSSYEPGYTDHVYPRDFGGVCFLDYVDPTYFEEIYVGTCSYFPTRLYYDAVSVSNYGFLIGDPYVDTTYFSEDYVGIKIFFNS